ncbi:hypothetical protein K493DRAFT_347936 [Basidiobolus meristosporus CBS 931.73]|uniref:Uncharacterized protein n=1 Tax=Basidiobolus meristosporus CBS 931.73 TaxID=1314790 RepID=A0A1Y1YQY4_9FUNG|nr:hypothetical protein K493DRAFT_347936 [Basidiobolus meristosporus CBS 931.73]|eukprot:ORY00433.1 hypothetical protein K493DRAFT_347936 [Basidiobolus meristosporus CBS 931.73]
MKQKSISDEDRNETLVPRLLCSCGLTFAIVAFLLIPVTVVILYILPLISQNFYLNWLDASLLTSIAEYTFFGAIFSLFGLLPLAYFYMETDLFKGFLGKLYEALSVFVMVSALAIILGITTIFEWTHTIPLTKMDHRDAVEKVLHLERDRDVLQQRLEVHQAKLRKHMFDDSQRVCFDNTRTLVSNTTRSIFTVLKELKGDIHSLERTLDEKRHKAKSSPFRRNAAYVLALATSTFGGESSTLEQYREFSGISALKGDRLIEPIRKIRPTWGNTSMGHIIANVGLMLVIGTTLPTIVPLLGLTKLDLIGIYPVTDYTIQNHYWFPFVYRLFIVISGSYTVLDRHILAQGYICLRPIHIKVAIGAN